MSTRRILRAGTGRRAVGTAVLLGFLVPALLSQDEKSVTVTNVAVPLRVYEGNRFVETLGRQDVEVFEDGKAQKVTALYLVKTSSLIRRDDAGGLNPPVSRYFYLLFQLTDYHPKLSDLVEFLFQSVLLPDDHLIIQTPMRSYFLSRQVMAIKPKNVLAEELNGLLRTDIRLGAADYNSQLTELKKIVRSIADVNPMAGIDSADVNTGTTLAILLPRYKVAVDKMQEFRLVDEGKILQLANRLKKTQGQKNVFLIYQREFKPEIQQIVLNQMLSLLQEDADLAADLQGMFLTVSRGQKIDDRKLAQAFNDASVQLHFLYMHKEPEQIPGIDMREQSGEIFRAFSGLAQETGGIADISQDPSAAFKKAVEGTAEYYLLYYEPTDTKKDGRFRTITVKPKSPNLHVVHRSGYFSD